MDFAVAAANSFSTRTTNNNGCCIRQSKIHLIIRSYAQDATKDFLKHSLICKFSFQNANILLNDETMCLVIKNTYGATVLKYACGIMLELGLILSNQISPVPSLPQVIDQGHCVMIPNVKLGIYDDTSWNMVIKLCRTLLIKKTLRIKVHSQES